ncbi:MAG: hypothetical protein JWN99_2966 [Ilumatobacteraceae bacterium]|nr:hypothetical protein [Ilumatobacteraceae bacterium]
MTRLVVTQSTLYGRPRLYVSDPYGGRIGWVDLTTGVVVLERRDLEAAFRSSVEQWHSEHDQPARVLVGATA